MSLIKGPADIHRFADLTPVRTLEDLRACAQQYLVRNGKRPVLIPHEVEIAAYVSDSRWVCQCVCGSGAAASREWDTAICFECGSVYHPSFPDDADEAERVLSERPLSATRNYFPTPVTAISNGVLLATGAKIRGETAADLAVENREQTQAAIAFDPMARIAELERQLREKGGL